MATMHRIELILRKAAQRGEPPLAYAEIERRLPVKKARRDTTKAVIAEFKRLSFVAEGAKGVMWVLTTSDEVWGKPRTLLR